MKNLISTIALLLLASMSFAQGYQPFNELSSKRFFENGNPSNNSYFFELDSTFISGDTTVYSQYRMTTQTQDFTDYCGFWGSSSGIFLDTTWLGIFIKWNPSSHELMLNNYLNESIVFDFNLPLGGSAPFYSNASTEFVIQHTSDQLETFYGVTDSIRVFEIQAVDNGGNPISSTLNNFEIKLSKNHGLLSFINCYEFPSVQQGLELQGQTNPDLGEFNLTKDEAYPWQTGDVLQYRNSRLGMGAQADQYNYQTLSVTDRIETADSVWIYLSSFVINPSQSPWPFTYARSSQPIIYRKGSFVSTTPWNKPTYTNASPYGPVVFGSEYSGNFCPNNLKALGYYGSFVFLCDSCQCYGDYDGNGTSTNSITYLENYGVYSSRYEPYGYLMNGTGLGSTLIYGAVNGLECGTYWSDQDELVQFELSIAPNPTKDIVKIESDQPIDAIRVLDLFGRVIIHSPDIASNFTEISIASFEKGAYILEVTANGSTQTRTIIRE